MRSCGATRRWSRGTSPSPPAYGRSAFASTASRGRFERPGHEGRPRRDLGQKPRAGHPPVQPSLGPTRRRPGQHGPTTWPDDTAWVGCTPQRRTGATTTHPHTIPAPTRTPTARSHQPGTHTHTHGTLTPTRHRITPAPHSAGLVPQRQTHTPSRHPHAHPRHAHTNPAPTRTPTAPHRHQSRHRITPAPRSAGLVPQRHTHTPSRHPHAHPRHAHTNPAPTRTPTARSHQPANGTRPQPASLWSRKPLPGVGNRLRSAQIFHRPVTRPVSEPPATFDKM